MSAALGLYRLQQVDSQMDHARARLKAIQQILENDAELLASTERCAAAEHRLREAERLLKQSEQEVEKQRIKIQQAEASLYGGRVHNPKELQDLQKDVASLKRHLETLEERELEAMEAVEDAEKAFGTAQSDMERIKASRGEQFRSLTEESTSLNRDLERFSSERLAVVQDINPQTLLNVYEQLRKHRRGIAVTTLSDSSCSACGTTLTASQQQSAHSTSQLFYCPSCGRILYAI